MREIKEGRTYDTDVEREGYADLYPNMDDDELLEWFERELDDKYVACGYPQEELDELKRRLHDRVWRVLFARMLRLGKDRECN